MIEIEVKELDPSDHPDFNGLTKEMLMMLAKGESIKNIAAEWNNCSYQTVLNYREKLRAIFNENNDTLLVLKAIKSGYIKLT